MARSTISTRVLLAGVAAIAGLAFAGCGSSKDKSVKANPVALSISGDGKAAKYTVPASVKGGLVDIGFTNSGKSPHGVQLVRIKGSHTAQEALKVVSSDSAKTPEWLRAEGGIGSTTPGATSHAVLNLPAGRYLVTDVGGPGSNGPPAYKQFTVSKGSDGLLPSTATTVTAATAGKDKYEWRIGGDLKPDDNQITFVSKGKDAVHLIVAFRVKGNPSKAEIVKGLKSNGPPPAFVDQKTFTDTAVLDGGASQTTDLNLNGAKSGDTYVLFCPLTDRDGGKSHDQEGLLTTVKIK